MILQSLTDQYEALVRQRKLDRPGWSEARISYILSISGRGELEQVDVTGAQPQRRKGAAPSPRPMILPAPVKRTGNPRPNFLWDHSGYLLGVDNKDRPQLVSRYFSACKALHHRLLDGVDSPAAGALLAFFDRWDPACARLHPALREEWEGLLSGANLVFRHEGAFVHEDPLIRQAWQSHYDAEESGPRAVCLVTGRTGPAEAVHPAVKGVAGAQSSGAALVSFNAPSFCSYGKEQDLNAPVSKYAAFAYTAALNYMVAHREHNIRVGDTTVLFWAKDGQSAYPAFFSDAMLSSRGDDGTLKWLLGGGRVIFQKTCLDPRMDFYILGISPNAARLSVRFFLHDSFGGFLQNLQDHRDRLEIIRPAGDKHETVPLRKLLAATVDQAFKARSPSPVLAGETLRAILTGTPYPASLLNGVTLRIRSDHRVDRTRAAVIKGYYLKNPSPEVQKEVFTVSLDPNCTDPAYVLGRLFSVYEAIQSAASPGVNATVRDKYFNTAASIPATIFPILGNLAQSHLKKLKGSNRGLYAFYEKQLGEISALLGPAFPQRMSLPQQGAFQLGYYHQTQARYQKKKDAENV